METPTFNDIIASVALAIKNAPANSEQSFVSLLPFLRFEGEPFNLKKHFQLEPLFRMQAPRRTVIRTGRQVGKTQNFAAAGLLRAGIVPNYHILICEPSFKQMENFSTTVFKPLATKAYIAPYLQDVTCRNNVLLKEFKNGSRVHFTYCGDNAQRVRGLAGIRLLIFDEAGDIDIEVINIVSETMSAVEDGGSSVFAGTPTFTDNTLNVLFEQSSGGELHFKCEACNRVNIAAQDQDIYKMIGKSTCICVKCGKPLDVRKGWYGFARPELRASFDGFHLSQITHPIHCTNTEKWTELLRKYENYPPQQFANEILGIPFDESIKLLTRGDLENCSTGIENSLQNCINNKKYSVIAVGVDWGGGGLALESFTSIAVMGWIPLTHTPEVLYMERFPIGLSSIDEVNKVITIARTVRASVIAHDSTGAGKIREELLIQSGAGAQFHVIPFWYVWAPRQDMLVHHPPQPGFKSYYSLDKTRSLSMMVAAIKARQVKFPTYKSAEDLFKDFLSLGEDLRKSGSDKMIRVINRMGSHPDDTAHAVNFGCQALWHMHKHTPSLGTLINNHLTE